MCISKEIQSNKILYLIYREKVIFLITISWYHIKKAICCFLQVFFKKIISETTWQIKCLRCTHMCDNACIYIYFRSFARCIKISLSDLWNCRHGIEACYMVGSFAGSVFNVIFNPSLSYLSIQFKFISKMAMFFQQGNTSLLYNWKKILILHWQKCLKGIERTHG